METLRELLGAQKFTIAVHRSWVMVYNVLAGEMCHGMNSDKIVLETWAKVKTLPYYKKKAGLLLFHHLFQNCPQSKTLFGIPEDYNTDDPETLSSNHKLRMHSGRF